LNDSSSNFTFEAKDCEICVRAILEEMTKTLSNGDRVEIRGFGSFAVNTRPARAGRNPKTGEAVIVAQKKVPHFKCGKELRIKMNQKT
jgi:integration host factor subunit beta